MKAGLNLLLILLCGIFIVVGVIITTLTKNDKKIIKLSTGLTMGIMLSLVVGNLIPDAVDVYKNKYDLFMLVIVIVAFMGAGLLLLKIFDFFIPKHGETKASNEMYHFGLLSSMGIIFYNLVEGMLLYKTFAANTKTGLLLSLAVGLHNVPLGMIIASAFYRFKNEKKKFYIIVGIIVLSTFIGGLMMFLFHRHITNFVIASLLCMVAGTLVYTIFGELMPYLKKGQHKEYSVLGLASGVLIFIISTLIYN